MAPSTASPGSVSTFMGKPLASSVALRREPALVTDSTVTPPSWATVQLLSLSMAAFTAPCGVIHTKRSPSLNVAGAGTALPFSTNQAEPPLVMWVMVLPPWVISSLRDPR